VREQLIKTVGEGQEAVHLFHADLYLVDAGGGYHRHFSVPVRNATWEYGNAGRYCHIEDAYVSALFAYNYIPYLVYTTGC